LAQIATEDTVLFRAQDDTVKQGLGLRLNKKIASLRTDDGQNWNVSPELLRKDRPVEFIVCTT
jgi:hypothetical protein